MEKGARTFPEIWQGLTPTQQNELRDRILQKTGVTTSAFWFWKEGQRVPSLALVRRTIAAEVSKYLNITATEYTLFPKR